MISQLPKHVDIDCISRLNDKNITFLKRVSFIMQKLCDHMQNLTIYTIISLFKCNNFILFLKHWLIKLN